MPTNNNPWIEHVKAVYGRAHGKLTYQEAMVRASATWRKKKKKPTYRGWTSSDKLRVANDVRLAARRGMGFDESIDYLLTSICKIRLTDTEIALWFRDGSPSFDRYLAHGATADKVRAFLEKHHFAHLLTAEAC
jgi:hypothetical protein